MRPSENFIYPDLKNIIVVLIETQTPGNMGSVARVMKNFGMTSLRLVRPECDFRSEEARWMAVHAEEILSGAVIFDTLHDALEDCEFSIATTNRRRDSHFPTFSPRAVADRVAELQPSKKTAIVFGGERNGLSTEDIHVCSIIATIPTMPEQNSLNLSHAVMAFAYELFQKKLDGNPSYVWDLAKREEVDQIYRRIQRVLEKVEFKPRKTNEDFMLGLRRILGRTPLEDRDARLIQKIFQEIERYVDRLKIN